MTRTLPLIALALTLACSTSSQSEEPTSGPDQAPAVDKTPEIPDPSGSGPLSSYFPFVDIDASTGFANDRGMMTSVKGVKVAGKDTEQAAVLAAIVAHWKGWSQAGGQSDEDVIQTTRAFVEAWDGLVREERVTSAEAPDELRELLAKQKAPPAYHPPTFEVRDVGGERVVVTINWVRGYVGMTGRTWTHWVRAYRVKDGSVFPVTPESGLTMSWSVSSRG